MDVCGIDPGLGVTGYAVVRMNGDTPCILDAGCLRTTKAASLPARLVQLVDDFEEVLQQCQPAAVAVELLYAHYRHPRTAIQMGHARGVLLYAARRRGIRVHGYSATHVKRYLTGNGRAGKVQVQRAIQSLFGLPTPPEPNDVADAIAIAYCCGRQVVQDAEVAR